MLAKVQLDAGEHLHAEQAARGGAQSARWKPAARVLCERSRWPEAPKKANRLIATAERLGPQARHRLPVSLQLPHAVPEERG